MQALTFLGAQLSVGLAILTQLNAYTCVFALNWVLVGHKEARLTVVSAWG